MKKEYWIFGNPQLPCSRQPLFCVLLFLFFTHGCTGVNTFPTVARTGDTVSVMVGGSDKARKTSIDVSLTDSNSVVWDLQSLGLVRSVFNLRPDGRAHGLHYSPWLDAEFSWLYGHEPVQTVLVADIPSTAATGPATLDIDLNVDDNSSGISDPSGPFTVSLEIIAGTGSSTVFERQTVSGGTLAVDFGGLEPAPHAKISFGDASVPLGSESIAAVSLVVDFDENIVNPGDLNVYVPASAVKGTFTNQTEFGDKQRMVAWRQDGSQLFIDIIAPESIEGRYLQIYVLHPRSVVGDPLFTLVSSTTYDLNGNVTSVGTPTLTYYP